MRIRIGNGLPKSSKYSGSWCHAVAQGDHAAATTEFARLRAAVDFGHRIGLEIHAGHGLDYETAEKLAALANIAEFNIGHFIIGEAIFLGLPAVIAAMRNSIERGRARLAGGGI